MINATPESHDQVVCIPTILVPSSITPIKFLTIECNKVTLDSIIWHNKLSHPHFFVLKQILLEIDEPCFRSSETDMCGACKLSKLHRLPFTHIHEWSSQAFEIIHVNIWNPSPIIVENGVTYFILFVDDHIRF